MRKIPFSYSKGAAIILTLFSAVFLFTASVRPAHAILGFGDISLTIGDVPRQIADLFNKIRQGAGSAAFHQAIRKVTYQLAQDTAVWIASGDSGRKPLIFTKSFGDATKDILNDVAGKTLVNLSYGFPVDLCSPSNIKSRLGITVGISKSLEDFNLFDGVDTSDRAKRAAADAKYSPTQNLTGQSGCSLSDIGNNYKQAGEDIARDGVLVKLQENFKPGKNDLSLFTKTLELGKKEQERQKKSEDSARQASVGGFKPGTNTIAGGIETPAGVVSELQTGSLQKSVFGEPILTGDIFYDAFQIFTNTLAKTYLTRLQNGLFAFRGGKSPDSLFADFQGNDGSRGALLAEYSAFSPSQGLRLSSGEVDLFADMVSCPVAEYKLPFNCILNAGLQVAVREKLTVRKAMESNVLPGSTLFPERANPTAPALSLENMRKLRFLRVLPVGWELAVEQAARLGSGTQYTLEQIVNCFHDPRSPSDRRLPQTCPRTVQGNADSDNIFYHLIDPDWVFDLPEQFCRAEGYVPIPEHVQSPNRRSACVDLQSCIAKDANGNCSAYGYCARERIKFELAGQQCDQQFATCKTLTNEQTGERLSLLTSYVTAKGCENSSAAGCEKFSSQKNPDQSDTDPADDWSTNDNIFINAQAGVCSESVVNSKEIVPLKPGVNLVKNADFLEALFALRVRKDGVNGAPLYEEGGWSFGSQTPEAIYGEGGIYRASGAVLLASARQKIGVKPYTYYTLSFYSASPGGAGAQAYAEVAAESALRNVSFDGYNPAQSGNTLQLTVPDLSTSLTRYAATFYSSAVETVDIVLSGSVLFDKIQLEEVALSDGVKAENTVLNQPASINLNIVLARTVNTASPATAFKQYEDTRATERLVFKQADECAEKEEASARKYTLASGGTPIIARVLAGDLCSASCAGFRPYLAMPTPIEKFAASPPAPYPISFASQYGQSCRAQEAGCEAFTNLSQGQAERREYYSSIQACVLDTNPNTRTYFTWEGTDTAGFQLKVWQLLKDNGTSAAGNGPCTLFGQGDITNAASAQCADSQSPKCSTTPDADGYTATCRVYLDEFGEPHARDSAKVVTASNQCTPFRRAKTENTANQETWYFVPSEARSCGAAAVGCREYKGASANLVRTVSQSTFEQGAVDGWGGGEVSAEAVNAGQTSYKVGPLARVQKNITQNISGLQEGSYMIKFFAKGAEGARITQVALYTGTGIASGSGNYYAGFDMNNDQVIEFADFNLFIAAFGKAANPPGSGADKDGNGIIDFPDFLAFSASYNSAYAPYPFNSSPVNVGDQWKLYEFGPVQFNPSELASYGLGFDTAGGDVYLDDIILQFAPTSYYLEQSVVAEAQGGAMPNACYTEASRYTTAKFERCEQYKDDKNVPYYISRFDRVFNERALSCTPVMLTHNYSYPYSQMFNSDSGSSIPVGADELTYVYIDKKNKVALSDAGCTEIGRAIASETSPEATERWQSEFRVLDPDTFNTTLCKLENLGCSLYTDTEGSQYTFRDPKGKLCEWDPTFGQYGGFIISKNGGDRVACPTTGEIGERYVAQCPAAQDSCTAYAPAAAGYFEGAATASFILAKSVEQGNCSGADPNIGCVEFIANYSSENVTTPPNPYVPDFVPPSRLAQFNSAPSVFQANQVRECAEWLSPTTVSEVYDAKSRSTRTVTYGLGRCQSVDADGNCQAWVDTGDALTYPGAYLSGSTGGAFDITAYQNRYGSGENARTIFSGAWDYTGYSIPSMPAIEALAERGEGERTVLSAPVASAVCTASCSQNVLQTTGAPFAGKNFAGYYAITANKEVRLIQTNSASGVTVGVAFNSPLSAGQTFDIVKGSELSCRSYPEVDSPFGRGTVLPRAMDAITGTVDFESVIDFSRAPQLRNVNLCEESGVGCDCSYKKVQSLATENTYYPLASTRPLPEDARTITDLIGWKGYCLEYDATTKNPNGSPACTAWWPVDVSRGTVNIFDYNPSAGFSSSNPVYYCLNAAGNNLPFKSGAQQLYYSGAQNNTYVFSVGRKDTDAEDNEAVLERQQAFTLNFTQEHTLKSAESDYLTWPFRSAGNLATIGGASEGFGPEGESGHLRYKVIPDSLLASLHEYDIESIVLKVVASENSNQWPGAGEEYPLQRTGFAKSGYANPTTNDRWTALWCGGNGTANCDFNNEYSWEKFFPYFTTTKCGSGAVGTIDTDKNTNIFAARARFADENGNGGSFGTGQNNEFSPYQFLGIEGGECDNTPDRGWVEFQLYFQLREYCTEVALVNQAGQNKAWSGRLNKVSQINSGVCSDESSRAGQFCYADSDCGSSTSGAVCNLFYNAEGAYVANGYNSVSVGAPIWQSLYQTANVINIAAPYSSAPNDAYKFTYTQDTAPFGAMTPPAESLFNPENWDSRANTEIIERFDGEKTIQTERALEPGKQPIYAEENEKQVRAGSPFACTNTDECLFPPSENAKAITRTTISGFKDGWDIVRHLFARLTQTWQWSKSAVRYVAKSLSLDGDYTNSASEAGQCPVMLAPVLSSVNGELVPADSFAGGSASPFYNAASVGIACFSDTNGDGIADAGEAGKYSINGTPVAATASGIRAGESAMAVFVGQPVSVQFYGFNYNGEQLPIKQITINWGEAGAPTIIEGDFKNHRPDCNENGQNWGQRTVACENKPFSFTHFYQSAGKFTPIVTIEDNWGKKTSSRYSVVPVISVEDALVAIRAVQNLAASVGSPSQGAQVSISWDPPFGVSPVGLTYKITRTVVQNRETDVSVISSIDGNTYSITSGLTSTRKQYIIAAVQACDAAGGCGQVISVRINFTPQAPAVLSATGSASEGTPYVFAFRDNFDASAYEFTVTKRYVSGSTSTQTFNKNVAELARGANQSELQNTFSYEQNLKELVVSVRACNGANCSAPTPEASITYTNSVAFLNPPSARTLTFGEQLDEVFQTNRTSGLQYSIRNLGTNPAGLSTSWLSFPTGTHLVGINNNPNYAGTYELSIEVIHSDGTKDSTPYTLTVNAPLPTTIGVSPSTHDFGAVEIGATVSRQFIITNSGQGVLQVGNVVLNSNQFTLSNPPQIPFSIQSNASRNIQVNFTPTQAGGETNLIRIDSNATNAPDGRTFITINGAGAEPASPPPPPSDPDPAYIYVNPTNIDFGSVPNGTNATRTFTIYNQSNDSNLAITNITIAGNSSYSVSETASTIYADTSRDVVITYNSNGLYNTAIIKVHSNANNASEFDVSVSANAASANSYVQAPAGTSGNQYCSNEGYGNCQRLEFQSDGNWFESSTSCASTSRSTNLPYRAVCAP